jgi:hypothetical protein
MQGNVKSYPQIVTQTPFAFPWPQPAKPQKIASGCITPASRTMPRLSTASSNMTAKPIPGRWRTMMFVSNAKPNVIWKHIWNEEESGDRVIGSSGDRKSCSLLLASSF